MAKAKRRLRIRIASPLHGIGLTVLVFQCVNFALAYAAGERGESLILQHTQGFRVLLVIVALMFVVVSVHELGHLFSALCLRMRVVSFSLLGFHFSFDGEEPIADDHLGSVGVRTTLRQDRPLFWAILALSGPAANLILTIVAGCLAATSPNETGFLLVVIATLSFVAAIWSLWPIDKEGLNDLSSFRATRDPDSQVFALQSLSRVWQIGNRADPLKFDPEDVRRAELLDDPMFDLPVAQIGAYYAVGTLAHNAEEKVVRYLEASYRSQAEASNDEELELGVIYAREASFLLAFCDLIQRRDFEAAERRFEEFDWIARFEWPFARIVDAAGAWANGDRLAVEAKIDTARKALRDSDTEHGLLVRLLDLLSQKPRASASA